MLISWLFLTGVKRKTLKPSWKLRTPKTNRKRSSILKDLNPAPWPLGHASSTTQKETATLSCTLLSPRLCAFLFLQVFCPSTRGLSPSPRTLFSNSSNLWYKYSWWFATKLRDWNDKRVASMLNDNKSWLEIVCVCYQTFTTMTSHEEFS